MGALSMSKRETERLRDFTAHYLVQYFHTTTHHLKQLYQVDYNNPKLPKMSVILRQQIFSSLK